MVTLNGILSNENRNNYGVPQCSVLAICFILYINHILCNLNIDDIIVTNAYYDTSLIFF